MMKEIDKIVKSKYPPKDTNVAWLDGDILKFFVDGKWKGKEGKAADFYSSFNEEGGMINMPMGYDNVDFSRRKKIQYNPSEEPTLLLKNAPPNIIVSYGDADIDEYHVVTAYKNRGIENAVFILGPVRIYYEPNHSGYDLYVVSNSFYSAEIIIIPLTYASIVIKKQLDPSWIEGYEDLIARVEALEAKVN